MKNLPRSFSSPLRLLLIENECYFFELSHCLTTRARACGVSDSVRAPLSAKWGGMSAPTIVPLAQRLAEENNVDWKSLRGSGPQGSVTEVDVLNYLARVMAGEEDLNPTAEPVPAGMEAWPEEDVRAHQAAQAGQAAPPQPAQPTATPPTPLKAPAPTPPATPNMSQAPQPQAAPQASAQTGAQQDAKPYVKKEAYLELLQKHKALTEQYTALTSKQSVGEKEAARFKGQAASLEGELATAKAQATSLKGELTALKEQVASLTKERDKERDKAGEALKRLPMLENENEALKTALSAEQAKVAQHRKASEELSVAQSARPWWKFWG